MLHNFVHHCKHDDLASEIELIEVNPMYARVKFPSGRKANVSLKDLAPFPSNNKIAFNEINLRVQNDYQIIQFHLSLAHLKFKNNSLFMKFLI